MSRRHERRVLEQADLVLVNYDSVARLIQETGVTPRALVKIPYTSESAFDRASRDAPAPLPALARLEPADAPLVVSVSRHDPRKGVDVLIEALAGVMRAGVPFRACLVGPGPLLHAHRHLARALGLDRTTAIVGHVPDALDYLTAADVFVLPSLEEGSGSVALLEALDSGAAVVASNVDGIPEDVTHGDSALLVSPGDADALATALTTVLSDRSLRQRLQRRAREVFRARFAASLMTDRLRTVYEHLLDPVLETGPALADRIAAAFADGVPAAAANG